MKMQGLGFTILSGGTDLEKGSGINLTKAVFKTFCMAFASKGCKQYNKLILLLNPLTINETFLVRPKCSRPEEGHEFETDLLEQAIIHNKYNAAGKLLNMGARVKDTHIFISNKYSPIINWKILFDVHTSLYDVSALMPVMFKLFEYKDWERAVILIDERREDLRGSIINTTKNSCTLLHLAASYAPTKILAKLIVLGTDCTAVNSEGNTPLHITMSEGQIEKTKLLAMERSEALLINNKHGIKPLELATQTFRDRGEFLAMQRYIEGIASGARTH
jgi:hypothetical protein